MPNLSAFESVSLEGRAIVITGGGSGIGRAAAELCALRGAKVVVADIDKAGAEQVAHAICAKGAEATAFRVDVSQEDDVIALIDHAIAQFGELYGAFNNAGVGCAGAVDELTVDQWHRVLGIDVTGVFLCMKHQLPRIVSRGGGAIVNTGSISSVIALPSNAGYDAAKHAVLGLTRSASLSHSSVGVRVNCVLPAAIETPLMRVHIDGRPDLEAAMAASHPIGRYGQAVEVAEAAAWLLSDAASFITGAALAVDGGYTSI